LGIGPGAPVGTLALRVDFPTGPAFTIAAEERAMTLTLTSQAFRQNGENSSQHTCQGADVSPLLAWSGVPSNAKSPAR
jgi:hypothetical protein